MRVDLSQLTSGHVSSEQNTKKVSDQQLNGSETAGSTDRTTFTTDSSSVATLVSKAMSSPEIRQDLVSQLRDAVSSGQYMLDPSAIATSMIDEHA
jgi:flagellar biosynthesis anti-sigma factor FlgM